MVLFRSLLRRTRSQLVQGGVEAESFKNLEFKHSWNNLVKMYDLRMWYMQNSPNEQKNLQYVHELEKLHNELNYQSARTLLLRYVTFLGLFYGFYAFYEVPRNTDWQDLHEPKHQQLTYGELEENPEQG